MGRERLVEFIRLRQAGEWLKSKLARSARNEPGPTKQKFAPPEKAVEPVKIIVPDTGEQFLSDLVTRLMMEGKIPFGTYTGQRIEGGRVKIIPFERRQK